jgi:signal transduction histidine kinase
LKIAVTRDRLVENKASEQLRAMVRWAMDFYAFQEAKRGLERAKAKQQAEPSSKKFKQVDDVLEYYREDIPKPVYSVLRGQVRDAIEASKTEAEVIAGQMGLFGALATAGIASLAYEHEVSKQLRSLEDIAKKLEQIRAVDPQVRRVLKELAEDLKEWISRARATRALFYPLMDQESRETVERFKARSLLEQVKSQVEVLTRSIPIDTDEIDDSLRLPPASFAEWSAIFQNVFVNAMNAMLDAKVKRIAVSSRIRGRMHAILVQDTGSGVDLSTADELFKPFVRKLKLSPERRALGLGGSGLGLTIVRMISDNLNCRVAFVEPDEGFKTAFQISWSEKA